MIKVNDMDMSKQLFDDYCYFRNKTDNVRVLKIKVPYLKPLKPTVDRLNLFDQLIRWCSERNIPVRQWLYTLFVIRYWKVAPKLETSHLCSENHVQKFYKIRDYRVFEEYLNAISPKVLFDANKDLVSSVEQRKRELLLKGGGQLCMAYMKEETFGFHPKSFICNHCDSRFFCYNELIKIAGTSILNLRSDA